MEETVNRLIDELGPVSEKLGEGAEHVYRLAVRQAIINGVTDLILAVILAAMVYVCYRVVVFSHAKVAEISEYNEGKRYESTKDADNWIVVGIVAVVVGFFPLGFAISALASGLRALLNPEFAAIQLILHSVVG